MKGTRDGLGFLVLWVLLQWESPAGATSYVPLSDEELVDEARLVATGVVVAVASAPTTTPSTDYFVQVEAVHRGFVPMGTLVIRQLGGVRPDGKGLYIWGAPFLAEGERALFFLSPHPDGTFRILHYMLGMFREVRRDGRRLLVRDLSEARVLARPERAEALDRLRDLDAFTSWIEDRARGEHREPDYFVDLPREEMQRAVDAFTLIVSEACADGFAIRWRTFDSGGTILWRSHVDGVEGLAGGGVKELRRALDAWNDDPATDVRLRYDGTTRAAAGFQDPDGVNTVLFGDPNDEISGTFRLGGTIAVGGPWFNCSTHVVDGRRFHPAGEGDIITNDGTEVWFRTDPSRATEVFAHELGHTLGLGHSCGDSTSPECEGRPILDEALMRAQAHWDGRGARLNSDDRLGLRTLYPRDSDGGPGSLAAPSDLGVEAVSASSLQLSWIDNSTSETGFSIERRTATGLFAEIASLGADATTFLDTGLPAATYFEYRVRATDAQSVSESSNAAGATTRAIPGPCSEDATTLCLNADRFRVETMFRTAQGEEGEGRGVEITEDTGYFWFFDSDNVEVVVKTLTACDFDGHFWVFAGGLTNVEVVMTVVDTSTGAARTYINPPETSFQPIQDTTAFATCP